MKNFNCLIIGAILLVAVGCRSSTNSVSIHSMDSEQMTQTGASPEPAPETIPGAKTVQHGSAGKFDYTIEMIPNSRLSATSREGDKPTEVYSSNIIAVYMQPHKGVTVNSTNLPAGPRQGDDSQPVGK